jgi:hypothetical protein
MADAQAVGDAGPEAFQDHVGARAERTAELGLGLQVADDRFLAGVQRVVPGRREGTKRIAARRLEPHDARAEAQELAAGERAG